MAGTVHVQRGPESYLASPFGWGRTVLAALAGSLPPALFYAPSGATAGSFDNVAPMFLFVLLIAGLFWIVSRRIAGK